MYINQVLIQYIEVALHDDDDAECSALTSYLLGVIYLKSHQF